MNRGSTIPHDKTKSTNLGLESSLARPEEFSVLFTYSILWYEVFINPIFANESIWSFREGWVGKITFDASAASSDAPPLFEPCAQRPK